MMQSPESRDRKRGHEDSPGDRMGFQQMAAPKEKLLTRKKYKASSTTTGFGNVEIRFKDRYEKYLEERLFLNKSFAEWGRKKLEESRSNAYANANTEGPPDFHLDGVREYIRCDRDIQDMFHRPPGHLMLFGTGDAGQLALGDEDGSKEAKRPTLVLTLRDKEISKVECGGMHNIALSDFGCVYTWGMNDEGALGNHDHKEWFPEKVKGFLCYEEPDGVLDESNRMISVAAGNAQSLCLSLSGRVYMCGSYRTDDGKHFRDIKHHKDKRKDRDKNEMNPAKPAPRFMQSFPIHVRMPKKVKKIACGSDYNAAILEDNTLVTWGISEIGALGRRLKKLRDTSPSGGFDDDYIARNYLTPLPPEWAGPTIPNRMVVDVACGAFHLMVVVREGPKRQLQLYTSGMNNYGQLGHSKVDSNPCQQLTKVDALDGKGICKVSGGLQHSLCVDITGKNLFSFGRGDSGQLGITEPLPELGYLKAGYLEEVPTRVPIDERIIHIACGDHFCLAVAEGGNVYTWGYGDGYALGHGISEDKFRPTKVERVKGIGKNIDIQEYGSVKYASAGGQHSAIIIAQNSSSSNPAES